MKHLTTVLSKLNRPLPAWLTLVLILGTVAGAAAPVFNGFVAIPSGAKMNLPGSGTVVDQVPCTGLGWLFSSTQIGCMDQYGNVGVPTSLQVSEGLNTDSSVQSASNWHGIWVGTYDATYPPPHNNLISMVQNHNPNVDGDGDIAIGPCSLCGGDQETIGLNIGLGGGTLENGVTTGYKNIGIGNWALRYTTSGYQNIAIGVGSGQGTLANMITGHDNTFLGYASGSTISSGSQDEFIGSNAGLNVAAASNDVGIGAGSLSNDTGGSNTAVGTSTGDNNTSGASNTFIGASAGIDNTTGSYDTFLGAQAGNLHTTGSYNTLLGEQAGYSLTTTSGNTFVGMGAGRGSTGTQNVTLGFQSGFGLTTGSENVLLGGSNGATSYNQVTTGTQNVAIGWEAAVPSATANGQLDIQNAIYGASNTGTDTTVSTGCLAFYQTTCTNGTVAFAVPIVLANGSATSCTGGSKFVNGIMVISGAGAPTCTAPAASMYLRSDGASGSHIYISQGAGTWTAISGV